MPPSTSPDADDPRRVPPVKTPEELEALRKHAQLEVDALRAFFGTPPESDTPWPNTTSESDS